MEEDIKIVGIMEITLDNKNKEDNFNYIRSIQRKIPRKMIISEIVETSILEDKVTCTFKLKRAPMISIDEVKKYIELNGERTTMKRFLKFLESLKN
jgi:hypothetical protein